jgi:tetratricopeptide (TPR) repeat protein
MTAGDPSLRAFCRDWYIVVVSLWSAGREYQQADIVAGAARSRLGDDARLLLAAGSAAEALMELTLFRGSREPNTWAHPASLGVTAVHADEWLGRAVKLDPTLVEARLRRGRVLYLFGRIPEARKELEQTLADASAVNHPFAAYLAAMFLGELFEHGGQVGEARAAYEKAIALHPEYQSAHLALGQLLVAAGKPEQGWAAARGVFGDAANPRNPERDPWFDYRSAQFWQAQDLVKGMFEWVRR